MVSMDYISGKALQLVKQYRTRDPFALSQALKIHIRYKDLGEGIKAFYFCQSRIRSIVINNRVGSQDARVLCAHELGHAVLHSRLAAARALPEVALFNSADLTEYEANLFAAELLIADEDLTELLAEQERTFFSVAQELCVPAELLDFKFRILKSRGYRLRSPIVARSDFLKSMPVTLLNARETERIE